jgi:hypothetical protein
MLRYPWCDRSVEWNYGREDKSQSPCEIVLVDLRRGRDDNPFVEAASAAARDGVLVVAGELTDEQAAESGKTTAQRYPIFYLVDYHATPLLIRADARDDGVAVRPSDNGCSGVYWARTPSFERVPPALVRAICACLGP